LDHPGTYDRTEGGYDDPLYAGVAEIFLLQPCRGHCRNTILPDQSDHLEQACGPPKNDHQGDTAGGKDKCKKGECGCNKPSCQQDGADQKSGKQGFSVLQREHRQFSSLFIFAEKRGTVIVRKDEIDLIGPRTFV